MNGIILMDKQTGISSAQFLNKVKQILGVNKAGHTGTLDPFASGLMTVCINKATRIIPFLNENIKEYKAIMKLGESTDTMDCTGKITEKVDVTDLDKEVILTVVSKYQGYMEQTPPDFSAVRVKGARLYKLARKGIVVEKPKKRILIEKLSVNNYSFPYINFFIRCSRGTYVRAIADSIGKDLGVGSHLTDLRRIKSGDFSIENSYTLKDVEMGNYRIMDLNESLNEIKVLNIDDDTAYRIKNGINIKKYMLHEYNMTDINKGDKFRIVVNNELIGIVVSLVSANEIKFKNDNDDIFKIKKILH